MILMQLFKFLLKGFTPSKLLTVDPVERGHRGEAILRLLTAFGCDPINPSCIVTPCHMNPSTKRIESIDAQELLTKGVNAGGSNKVDAAWKKGDDTYILSSKIGMNHVTSIDQLDLAPMIAEVDNSNYTHNGQTVKSYIACVLVQDKAELEQVLRKVKASNYAVRQRLKVILDTKDLDRMAAVLLERVKLCTSKDLNDIIAHLTSTKKSQLRTRYHQKLLLLKMRRLINAKVKEILLGAVPRSGKTYIGADLARAYNKILVITTRPGETSGQWLKVFTDHADFNHHVISLEATTSNQVSTLNNANERIIAVASMQFMKGDADTRSCLKGLDWDLVILDEVHEGGSTTLSKATLDTYIGPTAIRILMTATYNKPVEYYNIPSEHCCFWDLEDVRLMRTWPDSLPRLCIKYGKDVTEAQEETYKSGETDESIRKSYENAPELAIFTTAMQQETYARLLPQTQDVYGFSNAALFALTNTKFQHPDAVDTFLELVTGSNKMLYKNGDMSMFSRIKRYFQHNNHRGGDTFLTQIWFLPFGQGQLVEDMKGAIIQRMKANRVLQSYDILTLDSGSRVNGKSVPDMAKEVSAQVIDAKAAGKNGVILLTGNVASLGISLPDVDVAFLLHEGMSADLTYQQMMRVCTEMLGKTHGIVVDFNLWRVLTTMNTYATSRCGINLSSADRIRWIISHLVDIDPDLWQTTSPEHSTKENIADTLTTQWRTMLEKRGATLTALAKTRVDLGDDQNELDRIVKAMTFKATRETIEVNPDQEMNDGIEVRESKEKDQQEDTDTEGEDTQEESQKANLYEVLARIIPEIAHLSGCEPDIFKAMHLIQSNPEQNYAMNEFLNDLYGPLQNRFSIILRIMERNSSKLIEAKETYEVISSNMSSLLDNPAEVITFLVQHLKPKESEKDKNGEVFTPPEFIERKLDELVKVCPTIFKDPTIKFLDTSTGIGNYPALIYHRLMKGLTCIPEQDRKQHILENMIYMCELNKKNVEMCRMLFDPLNKYKLNLYSGRFQDLNPETEWGVSQFTLIAGNPPYNKSHEKKDGQGGSGSRSQLYPTFVKRSIDLLKPDGYLAFVHPPMWRKPESELREMFSYQLHFLQMYTKKEGSAVFKGATTRIDWYILQKTIPSLPTRIIFDDKQSGSYTINSDTPFICSRGHDIFKKMYAHLQQGEAPLGVVKQAIANSKCKPTKSADYSFPLIHSTSKKGVEKVSYSKEAHRNQSKPKVVYAEIEVLHPVYDKGAYGTTDNMHSIFVKDDAEGAYVCRLLSSKLYKYIVASTKWSMFRTDHTMFQYIPYPLLPSSFTDTDLYKHYDLSEDQIKTIEKDQKVGLESFVFHEATCN